MAEQNSSSISEYKKVLTKILSAAQKNSRLWNNPAYISGALPLTSIPVCEQDNDNRYYGITKDKINGKLVYCFADGHSNLLDNEKYRFTTNPVKMAKELEHYKVDLKSHFLNKIEVAIRKYEVLNAGIEQKVKRKMKNLEAELA